MTKPLVGHLVAHLGGGIGRALRHLICNDASTQHEIISIDETRDRRHVEVLNDAGAETVVFDRIADIAAHLSRYDIVQIEYWNHPRLYQVLSRLNDVNARWLLWSHISGRTSPCIPAQLPATLNACIFSTQLSLAAFQRDNPAAENLHFIASAAGLAEAQIQAHAARAIDALYVGTLSPAKIHPDYAEFLKRFVELGFGDTVIAGDISGDCNLPATLAAQGIAAKVELAGHVDQVQPLFEAAKYFFYILNPGHYGTSENALIEAMSAGVVPIVLDNQIERDLVAPSRGGYIIKSADDLIALKDQLLDAVRWRQKSENCLAYIAEHYPPGRTASEFDAVYQTVLGSAARPLRFDETFGRTPHEWFLSTRADAAQWRDDYIADLVARRDYAVTAVTKGSVAQFCSVFPEDPVLQAWSAATQAQASAE